MAMIGMDVQDVTSLATEFDNKANDIDSIIRAVENKLTATTWVGTDATTFRNDWASRLKPSLLRVAGELRAAASTARKNASAQTSTSASL